MKKLMLAVLPAFLLSGCLASKRTLPPSFLPLPPVPPALATPCQRTAVQTQSDGSMNSADAERALRQRDGDLARCDGKRAMGAAAWPTLIKTKDAGQ